MNVRFTAKTLCTFLAVLAATAIALMFDAAPPARAGALPLGPGHRGALIPSSPLGVTLTVTTTADSNITPPPGSLREAILFANPGDTINFSFTLPATITLNGAWLGISKDLTITGPGSSLLAVSGGNLYPVFIISSGNVTISGLTIRDGVGSADGGGINNAGTLTITDSTIISNTASSGGAGIMNTGTLYLSNTKVFSNTSSTGGGIRNDALGHAIVDQSTLKANNALGGGIYNLGFLTVTNSALSGNIGTGGAIWSAGNSTLVMTNTTVSGQQDLAIFVDSNAPGAASAALWNSDVISNTSTGIELDILGSGVTSTLSLHNSIVAYNGGFGNFLVYSGTVTSLGYNLSDGTIPNATTGDQQNVTNVRVGPLANNGGATQTMALLPGSPAINAGSNSGCPATDQRGIARPRTTQNPCDIGAFENSYLFLPLIEK